MIYELLFGRGKLDGGGHVARVIKQSRAELDCLLLELIARRGVSDVKALLPRDAAPQLARFARVNLLKSTVAEALDELATRGFELEEDNNDDDNNDDDDEAPCKFVARGRVRVDADVPYVLEFAPGTDLHDDALVLRGALVLQDKSSCLPPHCLAPSRGACCIDACAAPGNKTTQLAALVGVDGRVLAVDRDRRRLTPLVERAQLAGASQVPKTFILEIFLFHFDGCIGDCFVNFVNFNFQKVIEARCDDFLRVTERVVVSSSSSSSSSSRKVNDNELRRVEDLLRSATHALVDPSCSVRSRATQTHAVEFQNC